MRAHRHTIFLIVVTVVLIVLAQLAESVYFSDFEFRFRTKMFNRTLSEREQIMDDCINSMKPILAGINSPRKDSDNNIFFTAEKNGITILYYFDKKLVLWSDNDFDVPSVLNDSLFSKPLVFLHNGWFLTKTVQSGNEKIIGLLRLHSDYSFENNIIRSGFDNEFRIPANVGLSTEKKDSEYHVFDKTGDFLFSLMFPTTRGSTLFILIPLCLWTGGFIFLLLLVFDVIKRLAVKGKAIAVCSSLLIFILIYSFILFSGKPAVIFQTELFSPYRFTLNSFIPSLGHLLVLSILGASLSIVAFRYLSGYEIRVRDKFSNFLFLSVLLIAGAVIVYFYHEILTQLVLTSNINFETYKVLELSVFTLLGFVSVFLLLLIPVFYFFIIFRSARYLKPAIVVPSILFSSFFLALFFLNSPETLVPIVLFFMVMQTGLWLLSGKIPGLFNLTVIFSVFTGTYLLYFVTTLSEDKITENLKTQAVALSTEHDPAAEHHLLDLWPVIANDTLLSSLMKADLFDRDNYEKIYDYLQNSYFSGFRRDYHFSLVLCQNNQPLVTGKEKYQDCFNFFDERIKRDGRRLTGTNFYFIDNQGGRSDYLGRLFYDTGKNKTNGLFIEIYNDVNIFQPGYYELLLDKRNHGYSGLKNNSFAKYINGEMVLSTGDFSYDKSDTEYIGKYTSYRVFSADGFKHVLLKSGNTTVIVSRPLLTPGDIIISFAYIFSFILFLSNVFVMLIRKPVVKNIGLFNFRQKLQLSYILILLSSFILIGVVVAYITINQYKSKHYENMKEKLNSVNMEIGSKLLDEMHLSSDWKGDGYASLNEMLIKLSNIFNTDINLYNTTGFLIATSRQEIFDRDLTGPRINKTAFNNLKTVGGEFYQKEQIGKLEYLSAYIPILNADNKVIGYLNLPYFRMQSVLAKEISNLVVAVINFTLLLILITMGLAVIISGRLTAPLAMLGEGLATVGVGKKSEHLEYSGHDEIGELVKQYNRMVDEIEDSTHKLADSEREYAWREMAKQVAHEIKNPLTPMKLNVQQLLKSWNDNVPGFDKTIERFTKNQIEYIDNLSSIASAFSSFAKMPVTNPVEVNILDQIKLSLELFKNTDNVTFRVHWPHETKIVIYADKEQLNGVFSNLIKNGIQSVPAEKAGLITIGLEVIKNKVIVSVSDNGSGIPEELRKKLFTPNFTTKSSGTGLGLSIVRKYIENANGRIWFESEVNKGSVFYFELPVVFTVEKPGT